MTTELTTVPHSPTELMRQATDVAGLCREIVTKTAANIQGKKYVKVEGWQAISTAHGCVLSIENVEEDEAGNVTAKASCRRIDSGSIVATAEGFVGVDEPSWQKRPRYARRAMAQTRAMSRVARSAFAHVVVLIDSNLSTTPAEEVPEGGFDNAPARPMKQATVHSEPAPAASDDGDLGPQTTPPGTEMIGWLKKIVVKPTKKGGNRYGLLITEHKDQQDGGDWIGTFDEKDGALAQQLEGKQVCLLFTVDGTFKNLVQHSLAPLDVTP